MKAFLIDPSNESVTEVDYNGDFHQIYTHIGATMFDCVRYEIDGQEVSVFVDDEGLINGNSFGWFELEGFGQPLVGKGLVLGVDDEGETVAPSCQLFRLRQLTKFGEPARKPTPGFRVTMLS